MELLGRLDLKGYPRVPGVVVVASPELHFDAGTLVRYMASVGGLPKDVLLVRLRTEFVPHVPRRNQIEAAALGDVEGLQIVTLRLGYDDDVDLPRALSANPSTRDLAEQAVYCISTKPLAIDSQAPMSAWRRWLFAALARHCPPTTEYLRLPRDRTVTVPEC